MARKQSSSIGSWLNRLWFFVGVCGLSACLSLAWHVYSDRQIIQGGPAGASVSVMLCVLFGVPTCVYAIACAVVAGSRRRREATQGRRLAKLREQVAEMDESSIRQRERIDDLATLREVALMVNRESDFAIIAEKTLDLLAALINPVRASIHVIDESSNLLEPFADYDGHKVRTGTRMRSANLPPMNLDEFQHRSVVCVVREDKLYATAPLKVDEEILGSLLVVFPRGPRTEAEALRDFNEHQRAFLLDIGQHVSLAVKNKHLQMQVVLDGLTGLYTKSHFRVRMEGQADFARRHQEVFSLILVDIDHFKNVNDTYGHATGDVVLAGVAKTLLSGLRKYDSGFRTGGEEMAVLLPRTDLSRAIRIAERLRSRIEKEAFKALDGSAVKITVSCGAAQYMAEEAPESLFERCDRNLYAAKKGGRNRVEPGDAGDDAPAPGPG